MLAILDFWEKNKKLLFNASDGCQNHLMSTDLHPQHLTWQCMVPGDPSNCYNPHCSMLEEGEEEEEEAEEEEEQEEEELLLCLCV